MFRATKLCNPVYSFSTVTLNSIQILDDTLRKKKQYGRYTAISIALLVLRVVYFESVVKKIGS